LKRSKQLKYRINKAAENADIEIPLVVNQRRRDDCEENLELFLKTYMPISFSRPFSDDQKHAILRIQESALKGGTFAEAMPRGSGKTTTIEGATIWFMLYGHRRYTVIIGSDQRHADDILRDIKTELECNSMLFDDFPEVCAPIEAIDGKAQRCASQTVEGVRTRMSWKTDKIVFPEVYDSKCGGHVIQSRGITSGVRGLKYKSADGDIRPDFVILDDPQTRDSATSTTQTATREKVIFGDVMGLAGHDKKISAVMPCTVIRKGDLADKFLDREVRPEWQGHRTKLIYAWSENEELWEKYKDIWKEGLRSGDGIEASTEFYRENREAMDKGCVIANDALYDKECELSAIHHAYNLLYSVGFDAFMAEYQNEPTDSAASLYDLSAKIILEKCGNIPRNAVPETSDILVAFTDINHYALSWTVVSFETDMTAHVVNYGKFPERGNLVEKNDNELTRNKKIFAGLKALGTKLESMSFMKGTNSVALNGFLIDRGYAADAVYSYIRSARHGFPVLAARGYASNKYSPTTRGTIGKPREECHVSKSQKGQFIAFNADFWREVMQKAWLPEQGSPGGISIFGSKAEMHRDFADEICCEYLLEKVIGERYTLYKWGYAVGGRNDYGDAVYGCYVGAAALFGLSPSGKRRYYKKKVKRGKKMRIGRI